MLSVGPVLLTDLAERHPRLPLAVWRVLKRQVLGGAAWSARTEGGALVAFYGLFPLAPDLEAGEALAWFAPEPACRRHLLAFARLARLTLESGPYGEVIALAGTAAGARLAGCVGFQPIPTPPGEPIRMLWRRHGSGPWPDRPVRREFEPQAG